MKLIYVGHALKLTSTQ